MTQEEFNTMLAVGISQGLPGSYYTSRYKNGEEIDRRLGNAAVPAVGDNILINADFRNPVNRNGKTEYSGDTYTIDCWKTYIGVVAVTDNGITLRENAIFTQIIQDRILRSLNGKTLTGSVLSADGTLYVGTGVYTYGETLILLNVGTPIHSQMYIEANVHGFQFYDHSKDVELVAAKLELGSTQTLAQKDTSGNWGLIDPPNYALQYALSSQYSPATGEWVGSLHSNPNLLDNWYFGDPINQRGNTEYSSFGYSIDRWWLDCAVNSGAIEIKDGYLHFYRTRLHDGTETFYPSNNSLCQPIDAKHLAGKTVTFSVLCRGTGVNNLLLVADGTLLPVGPPFISGKDWEVHSYTYTLPQTLNRLSVYAYCDLNPATSGYTDYVALKLELGPIQTLAHKEGNTWVLNDPPPNKALELLKCQRYFLKVPMEYSAYTLIGHGKATSYSQLDIQVSIPTMMRIPPVVIMTGNWVAVGAGSSEVFSAGNMNITLSSSGATEIGFIISGFSSLKPNHVYTIQRNNDPSGNIVFDSNL